MSQQSPLTTVAVATLATLRDEEVANDPQEHAFGFHRARCENLVHNVGRGLLQHEHRLGLIQKAWRAGEGQREPKLRSPGPELVRAYLDTAEPFRAVASLP